MKISVACAVYNGTMFLEKQMNSLRLQTHPIDEVIFYDDASSDHSVTCIQGYINQYKLDYWHIYRNTQNVGYVKNFQLALLKTTGDIIFLCDQDDIWNLEKVSICLAYFQQHPDIQCINTSFSCIDHRDKLVTKNNPIQEHNLDFQHILLKNIAMGCTMSMRRELLDLYVSSTSAIAPHDWEINALAASKNALAFLNQDLIQYRIHHDNTTGFDTLKNDSKQIVNLSREKNAQTIYQFTQALSSYTFSEEQTAFLKEYQEFSKLRYDLLHNKQLKNWFQLCKSKKIYTSLLSIKGVFLDLIYALQK